MITFATPWVFWAAVAASVVVLGWHLLSVRQPRDLLLPTARFVPPTTASAVARQPRPSDLLLLALRVLALLCIGLALSGARCDGNAARNVRLVLVDASLPDSVIAADSARLHAALRDTAVVWQRARGVDVDPGVAIVQAFRALPGLLTTMPRMEVLDVSVLAPPRVAERRVWDAWRTQWPGRVALLTPPGSRDAAGDAQGTSAAPASVVAFQFAGALRDDPVVVALRAAFGGVTGSGLTDTLQVQVDRNDAPASDASGDARADVRVHWPASGLPRGWTRAGDDTVPADTPPADTVGAVSANGQTLIGPFVRYAAAPVLDDSTRNAWRPVVWWSDGTPAAIARGGDATPCEVQVAVAVPVGSDLLLGAEARGLLNAVVHACAAPQILLASLDSAAAETASAMEPATAQQLRALTSGSGAPPRSPWMLLLLALAGGALLVEWRVRS